LKKIIRGWVGNRIGHHELVTCYYTILDFEDRSEHKLMKINENLVYSTLVNTYKCVLLRDRK